MQRKIFAFGIVLLGLGGCTTTSEKSVESDLLGEPVLHPFQPAHHVSRLSHDSGRYPTLYDPASYAVLITPEVLYLKAAAASSDEDFTPVIPEEIDRLDEHFWVFELRLESIFADSSIAYDVIGLRNMAVSLVTPEGERLMPLQRIPGSAASEELQGALRRFGRTSLVMFSKRDLISGEAWLAPDAPKLTLLVEGFHSQFSFSWDALPPATPPDAQVIEEPERWQIVRSNLVEFYHDLRTMMSMAH